ncbi:MAG: hypothetical protein CMO81_06430 [Waddliaceae bacterium]|nr:hypothetical protein [Waddliaceae bacterium]|tara:strand:- start:127 stop:366 length:240 start_codon:yes stop_codon:yes gene_type:complete
MSQFFLTAILAAVVIALALFAMAIGWLITGKPIKRGTCGYDPTKKKKDDDKECGKDPDCPMCGGGSIDSIKKQPTDDEE